MDLLLRTGFCDQLLYVFEILILVEEPLINSLFDVTTNQILILIIFIRTRVLFEDIFVL